MERKDIKIGLIGLGNRGMATLRRYRHIQRATFAMLCDREGEKCLAANALLRQQGCEPARTSTRWEEVCQSADVQLVYVCTNWDSHAAIALEALHCGKDVAVEVPLAMSVADCQRLVSESERSGRRLMMLENCCFDTFHLGCLGMVRRGLLGELTHLEGAYIHYLAEDAAIGFRGNPYPTHGLGPMCQLLGDDAIERMVSVDGLNSVCNTLLKTRRGVSLLLQFDETTPRPYSRLQTVCGTRGFAQKYPIPCVQLGDEVWHSTEAERLTEEYMEPEFRALVAEGRRLGVENLMNYVMDRRLMSAVAGDIDFDISVHQAALWSSVVELSRQQGIVRL